MSEEALLEDQIAAAQEQLAAVQERLAAKERECDDLKRLLETKQQALTLGSAIVNADQTRAIGALAADTAVLTILTSVSAETIRLKEQLASVQAQLASLEDGIKLLREELDETKAKLEAATTELEATTTKLEAAATKLASLKNDHKLDHEELASLKANMAELQAKFDGNISSPCLIRELLAAFFDLVRYRLRKSTEDALAPTFLKTLPYGTPLANPNFQSFANHYLWQDHTGAIYPDSRRRPGTFGLVLISEGEARDLIVKSTILHETLDKPHALDLVTFLAGYYAFEP
eukprot:m.584920 g.584920  ORF g.584920 m.584920 type:complete len:289 (-) comp57966_c0_seq2:157-1023(-)